MSRENLVYFSSMIFPWLALTWLLSLLFWRRCGTDQPSSMRLFAKRLWLPLAALIVILLPVHGLPLGRWAVGCNANFSIPLTLLVAGVVIGRMVGRPILQPKEVFYCWVFGLGAGLILYPMALGLTAFDPYSLGWKPGILLTAILALILAFLALGNRFAVWLLVALLAYNLRLLESPNVWDYLVDPIYAICAVLALLFHAGERCLKLAGKKA